MRPHIRAVFGLLVIVTALSLIITFQCCQYDKDGPDSSKTEEKLVFVSENGFRGIKTEQDASSDHLNQRRLSEASETVQYRLLQLEKRLSNMSDLQNVQLEGVSVINKFQNHRVHHEQLNDPGYKQITPSEELKGPCSKDPQDKPYLRCIHIDPPLRLSPSFTSINTVYEAVVDYDVYVIKVHVMPQSCFCQAKPEDSEVKSGSFNYTLGLGVNVLKLAVVDVSQNDPVKVNSYTLHIIRRYQDYTPPEHVELPLRTCVLKQDCRMLFSESEVCGLQPQSKFSTWNSYLIHLDSLPECTTGNIPGLWYVPCISCDDNGSCDWNRSLWQPNFCKHHKMSDADIKTCFTSKRLLFIGDSTNRGVLHYILERINGTLMSWDKTHHFRRYLNINNNKTVLSFAYYPQFWLPTNHRPSFDKAIYQLIKWTLPLENNTNTVLLVGGVQWLVKHHLNLIIKALQREELHGIQLIMKGVGAGFHQYVDGVMHVPMQEQRNYVTRERELSQYGASMGFKFVPTFNMTMARYRDFYPGQCACHFHKVIDKSSDKQEYHVEGHVNSVYSELIINEICKPRPPD